MNDSTEAPTAQKGDFHAAVTLERGLLETSAMPDTTEAEATGLEEDEPRAGGTEGAMSEPEVEANVKIPDSEPEPEPEAEPAWNPEGEAEWTGEAGPDEVDMPSKGGCNPCLAEPEPDWSAAKMEWQVAWEVHVYGTGILFAVLGAYSLLSILRLFRKENLFGQGYFVASNGLLLAMGSCRAVYFLVDGYNTKQVFHPVVAYCLYSVGFPCLTSAFSIIFLALLETLQMQVLSPRMQKLSVLIALIVLHFVLSLVTGVVAGFISGSKLMLLICRTLFVLWGLVLFCGYLYIFKNLHQSAVRRQRNAMQLLMTKSDSDINASTLNRKIQMKHPLSVATVVTLVTATLGLACVGLHVYAMVRAYGMFSTQTPKAWPWWSFMVALRIVELCMCAMMSFVATQPLRYRVHHDTSSAGGDCWTTVSVMPCSRMCDTTRVEDEKGEWSSNFGQVFQDLGQQQQQQPQQQR